MNLPRCFRLRDFLALRVLAQLPSVQIEGNLLDAASARAFLNAVAAQAAPNQVPVAYSPVTNSGTSALSLTPANAAEGIINALVVTSGGSANTNTTDTATNIISGFWPNAYVGSVALTTIVNLNSGTMTLAGGTGVTISGTATIPTLATGWYRAKVTNLAAPAGVLGSQTLQPGQASTNTTTTTSAVTNNAGVNNPTSVINVAATTGVTANASWIGMVNTDGTTSYYLVTAINSLALTVAGNINKNAASGAAVSVFNNTITFTRLFSTVTATMAA